MSKSAQPAARSDVTTRVLFDTTTLCAATRNPHGVSMKLLLLARIGVVEPVISDEIVAEWVRNCRLGLGRGRAMVKLTEADIDAFCDLLEPLLSPEMIARVRVGRAASPLYPIRHEGGLTIVQVPTGLARSATGMLDISTLGLKDIGDFHVVEAALRFACDFICTANTRDLADGLRIGQHLEVAVPERLYRLLTD